MLTVWSLVPLPFLNPAWTSGSSRFTCCWSLAWRILSITLLVCEMSAIVWYFIHSLALPFSGIGVKTDLFQSCGHCWVFQICWHIECSILGCILLAYWASLIAELVKNPPAIQETLVQFLGWEDLLEKGKAIHSNILAWRIPWGHKKSDRTERLSPFTFTLKALSQRHLI